MSEPSTKRALSALIARFDRQPDGGSSFLDIEDLVGWGFGCGNCKFPRNCKPLIKEIVGIANPLRKGVVGITNTLGRILCFAIFQYCSSLSEFQWALPC